MPKPICVPCERFYQPQQNGFPFLEGMQRDGLRAAAPGKDHNDDWQDYKLWVGDKWRCPGCGHEIVVGALNPASERHMPDFKLMRDRFGPRFRVNDC
jgi:hypothetical protein